MRYNWGYWGICLLCLASFTSQAQLMEQTLQQSDRAIASVGFRETTQQWRVLVDEYTLFQGPLGVGGDDFEFEMLMPGMMVMTLGNEGEEPYTLCATEVVFMGWNAATRADWGPGTSDDLFGTVIDIDYDELHFTMNVDGYQNTMSSVYVSDSCDVIEAWMYQPILDIEITDLMPGDPVMIYGYGYGDMISADVVVRTDDWAFSGTNRLDDELQLFGWVHDLLIYPDRTELIVEVDSLHGNPNHQSFTTFIDYWGGELFFPWGYMSFPVGAIDTGEIITVTGDFMFWETLQNHYEFFPAGLEFNSQVFIEIRYFNLEGINPNLISLSYFDENLQKWRIAAAMTHFPDEHCFRGYLEHFF